MKKLITTILLALVLVAAIAPAASASVYVRGYFRSNGTYVAPHYRSNPDGYFWNNWSTKGNYNPYTGQPGYRTYDYNYNYNFDFDYDYSYPSYTYTPSYGYYSWNLGW